MKLTKLIIQNFLSVQDAALNLADKGLVSIEGVNEDDTGSDSNGCGKSSIINAIIWCLYGSYGKDEAADDVVNSKVGKNCMVQTVWREDMRAYRITRYRKHSKGKNSITVEQLDMPMAQGESSSWRDITKAGAKEVQQQINDIMGADEMVFRASSFLQQENPVDIPAMSDKELKALLERCLPFDDLEEAFTKAGSEVTIQRRKVKNLESEITTETNRITLLKEELEEGRKAFKDHSKTIEEANRLVDQKISEKRKALGVALVMAEEGSLRADIAEIQGRQSLIGDTNSGGRAADFKYALKYEEQLKEKLANPDNTCGECGQEVEDLEALTNKLKAELALAQQEVIRTKKRFKIASENLEQHSDLEVQKRELEGKLVECAKAKGAVDRLCSEIKLLEGQKATVGSNPHGPTVTRLEGALRASEEALDKLESDLKADKERLEVLEAVYLTYSPKGVRYHMLEQVAPTLTNTTNKYLHVLTDGAISAVWSTVTKTGAGDYREAFSIEAQMEGRTKFGLLSGGEKRKVRLACFFALQDLIASRATKNIDIWCGDEIDEALDAAGLERLMVLLNEKTKSKSTILVISHNEMREWIPNHAVVTRKDGISTITGYLND